MQKIKDELKKILPNVKKPGRYMGGEINSIRKGDALSRFAICFPDLYEIGMSNLGISIIYAAINEMQDCACERVFSVDCDMEGLMKDAKLPLYSLESKSPIKGFDILGFSLQYELLYTNILSVLELSDIALENAKRGEDEPIIIAGGPCAYNPMPLSPFIDLFLIGEFDAKIKDFMEVYNECKRAGLSRTQTIKRLAQESCVYSPDYHNEDDNTRLVRKVIVKDLDNSAVLTKAIVPIVESVQDRAVVEISRGCTHNCRFCSAGSCGRPVRIRSPKRIVEIIKELVRKSGATDVNLSSLSADDYPNAASFIEKLSKLGRKMGFSLSLPSLRIDSFDLDSAKEISAFKKTGLTFALEAGSQRMRDKINKEFAEEEIFNIISGVKERGWKLVKLYFMIGFSESPKDEADDIIGLLKRLSERAGKKMRINASINSFIPKPHTPLQCINQIHYKEAEEQIERIRDEFRKTNVYIKQHPVRMSFVEGIFSRGGKDCSSILLEAYKNSARLDAWEDRFNFEAWKQAVNDCGYSEEELLRGQESYEWEFIDIIVKDDFLKKEKENFDKGIISRDCKNDGICHACGFNPKEDCPDYSSAKYELSEKELAENGDSDSRNSEVVMKALIKYSKKELAAFLGHFDIKRLLSKALFICGAKAAYSKGFSPKPLISFSDPLPFGVESSCEYCEISLTQAEDGASLKERLNSILNEGIFVEEVSILKATEKFISKLKANSTFEISCSDAEKATELLHEAVRGGGSSNIEFKAVDKQHLELVINSGRDFKPDIKLRLKDIMGLFEEGAVEIFNVLRKNLL